MRVLLTAALAACVATSAVAQGMPEGHREAQLRMLDTQRSMLLAMADSMPENLYRDKVTPIQRDFAQQIHHCASALAFIAARYFEAEMPALSDTATTFNSREGLRAYLNGAYDFAEGILRDQPADDRGTVVNFFGQMEIPKWQIWDEIHVHTMWTAGQVVANFRKNGMAPPAFTFF